MPGAEILRLQNLAGTLPANRIDVFATRVVYASTISGVALDCDLSTRAKIGGGTPTDNASHLNTVLATASAANPVHLIIDGGCAIGAPLVITDPDHTVIEGQGRGTGLYILPGSNCNAIQNFAHTDLANYQAWNPGGTTSVTGKQFTLKNLKIDGNRRTYATGNSNGHRDGTVTDATTLASTPDVRGPYTFGYWLCGIVLVGIDNVTLENVWIYDAPAYAANLFHCTRVRVDNCRIDTADPTTLLNTDGIHFNGGCQYVAITNSYFKCGDNPIAINVYEGDSATGGDVWIDGCTFDSCADGMRIYGKPTDTQRIWISRLSALNCPNRVIVIGLEDEVVSSAADCNHSIWIDGLDATVASGCPCLINIVGNIGHLDVRRVTLHDPVQAIPIVRLGSKCVVSSLVLSHCGIHRSSFGSAAAYAVLGSSNCDVGNLAIDNFRVTEQYGHTYTDIPTLIDLTGTTVGKLSLSADVAGVATVLSVPSDATCGPVAIPSLAHTSHAGSPSAHSIVNASASNIPVSVGRFSGTNLAGLATVSGTIGGSVGLTGPGLISSGLSYTDSLIAPGTIYNSSTQSSLAYKDWGGTVDVLAPPATVAATVVSDGFSGGTPGASIIGRVPDTTQNGSDLWTADGSLAGWVRTSSGAGITTPSGTSGQAWATQPLTGLGPDTTTTVVFSSSDLSSSMQLQLRRNGGSSYNIITVGFGYPGGGHVSLGGYVAGSGLADFTVPSYTFAAGTTYTAVISLVSVGGNTVVTVTVNGTTVINAFVITNAALQSAGYTELVAVAGNTGALVVSSFLVTTGTTGTTGFSTQAYRPIDAQTGTAYTLALGDNGKLVTLSNGSAITLTIPTNAAVAFPIGAEIDLAQLGAGAVTVSPAGGVTLNSFSSHVALAGQYAGATLKKTGTDVWLLVGNLA